MPNPIFTCNEPPLYSEILLETPALPQLGKNPPYLETLKTFLLRTSHLTNPPYGSPTANSYRLSSDLLQQFVIIIITLKTLIIIIIVIVQYVQTLVHPSGILKT